MYDESPVSERINEHASRRFGQLYAPLVEMKAVSIYGAKSSFPNPNCCHVARSREWKSRTLYWALKMFSGDFYVYIKGEKTYHGMVNDYGEDWDGLCFAIDDGALVLSSMGRRSRLRWLSAFSSLLTERKFDYSDNFGRLYAKGKITLAFNLTMRAYHRYLNQLLDTTLYNRTFFAFFCPTIKYNRQVKKNYVNSKGLKFGEKIEERYNARIRNLSDYKRDIERLADDYSILSVRSPIECEDIITAFMSNHARLNERNYVNDDDYLFVKLLKRYNKDPEMPNKSRVLQGLKLKRSYLDICHILGTPKSYKTYISRVKKEAEEKGALDYGK